MLKLKQKCSTCVRLELLLGRGPRRILSIHRLRPLTLHGAFFQRCKGSKVSLTFTNTFRAESLQKGENLRFDLNHVLRFGFGSFYPPLFDQLQLFREVLRLKRIYYRKEEVSVNLRIKCVLYIRKKLHDFAISRNVSQNLFQSKFFESRHINTSDLVIPEDLFLTV